jgi:DNA-directed RNA polymerase subunit omega
MNPELCRRALEKIGNPNILVNLISKRVRQLNSGGAAGSRALIPDAANVGAADIALQELADEKMGWERIEALPGTEPAPKRKRRS